ncbi:hypothetical protein BKA64DRAFT_711740 [Cadophora sp. MPI-SDFR-AT-0126]|nr:hypothetical protein BKA64DRAFT_711740 [Leotiomycetes sp. MPI-SDFR-AT-0126]
MNKNHYELLELERNSEFEEIKTRYRKLALKHHPDKNPEDQKDATTKFQILKNAYETLSDPQKRRAYDATLPRQYGKSSKFATTCDDISDSEEDYPDPYSNKCYYEDLKLTTEEFERQRELLRRQGDLKTLREALLRGQAEESAKRRAAEQHRKWSREWVITYVFKEPWDNRDASKAQFQAMRGWEKKTPASYAELLKALKDRLRDEGHTGRTPSIKFDDPTFEHELSEEEIIRLIEDALTPERTATSPLSKKEARALRKKGGKKIKDSKSNRVSEPKELEYSSVDVREMPATKGKKALCSIPTSPIRLRENKWH